ncbi:MAG TPA: hypothetical protein PKA10_09625 [Selenomonadales bacterium]|nr:hypothetical protein [Selenomonadales bacterium]
METPVQIAAKTLGLSETVLKDLLSLIEFPQPAASRASLNLSAPAATHNFPAPDSADLINALIEEYDRRL